MWENDDLGHAMSRSSVEDLEQPNAHEGYNLGTDNDDYGKALQDSLNSSAYPPYFTCTQEERLFFTKDSSGQLEYFNQPN
ncbi:uncharacterized protein [Arachis hypogaea]|uniref:uncharacterized protein n=1 Tax=Arachis hypogaea TaxID=3818 RepID=UPI003B223616